LWIQEVGGVVQRQREPEERQARYVGAVDAQQVPAPDGQQAREQDHQRGRRAQLGEPRRRHAIVQQKARQRAVERPERRGAGGERVPEAG
jgi:hypothetical protein